jgi:hypothetical protein
LQHFIISSWEKISHASLLHTTKLQIPFLSKKTPQISSTQEETEEPLVQETPVIVEEKPTFDRSSYAHIGETTEDSLIDSSVYDRQSFLKNKKLLEKIIYEALVLRKEGKFDEYEKKLIE